MTAEKQREGFSLDERGGGQGTAEQPGLLLTAYLLRENEETLLPLSVASAGRVWMAQTKQHFAQRCLPLLIANQAGWFVLNNATFQATWNGEDEVEVEYEDDPGPYEVQYHFGYGILTWSLPYLFRTPPGYNLLARGPANWPKHGLAPLEGIIETDWAVATFTMNWQITRAHETVTFLKDEPICMLVPQRRGELEQFQPIIRPIASEPELERASRHWSDSRKTFDDAVKKFYFHQEEPASEDVKRGWQKHYFQGKTTEGERAPVHQSKLRLRDFKWDISDRDMGDAGL